MAQFPPAIEFYLSADGLSAKVRVIAAHREVLLAAETEMLLVAKGGADDVDVAHRYELRVHAFLLKACRESGPADGPSVFSTWLANQWLAEETMSAKVRLIQHWGDPLLTAGIRASLDVASMVASNPDEALTLAWHADLLTRCRECGVEEGTRAHLAEAGEVPTTLKAAMSSALRPPRSNEELSAYHQELGALAEDKSREGLSRSHAICRMLLDGLPSSGPDDLLGLRASLDVTAATAMLLLLEGVALHTKSVDLAIAETHALFDEARSIYRRLKRDREAAMTAQNKANLYLLQYDFGDTVAGDLAQVLYNEALAAFRRLKCDYEVATTALSKALLYGRHYKGGEAAAADLAHVFYEEALAIFRRSERDVELATTARGSADLYLSQYEAGDSTVAGLAHVLYDDALSVYRRLKRDIDVALTAQNKAVLFLRQYRAGDMAAAGLAHTLFDEALSVYRRLKRDVNVAMTAQNKANLCMFQYEAGDATAAVLAHALFDEALKICRALKLDADVAMTAQNKASLYGHQYDAGDAAAATLAHALYDEALEIRRRLKREVEVAQTAQNKAILYASQYEAGDMAAAGLAHMLYDEALKIRHRLMRGFEAAMTAQNKANLYARQYEAGDMAAARLAHMFYDEALRVLPKGAPYLTHLMILNNRLFLFQAEQRLDAVAEAAEVILSQTSAALVSIPDRPSRNRLLTQIAGVGRRGAWAALSLDDPSRAINLLEAGHAQQLGQRLRESEAQLSFEERAALVAGRTGLSSAENAELAATLACGDATAALESMGDDPCMVSAAQDRLATTRVNQERAIKSLRDAHGQFFTLLKRLGLDKLAVGPPTAEELRARLGDALLLQPVWGKEGGALLLLAPTRPDWQVIPVPAMTEKAINDLVAAHLHDVVAFQNGEIEAFAVSLAKRLGCPQELETDHSGKNIRADNGKNSGPGVSILWTLMMEPLYDALEACGLIPAAGAPIAPEAVLCLPAELAVLPWSAVHHPVTGRMVFEDYALRLVPSLASVITAAGRASRPHDRSAVLVHDPLGDLTLPSHPAKPLFADSPYRELGGGPEAYPAPVPATREALCKAIDDLRPGYVLYLGHSGWDINDAEGSGIELAAVEPGTGKPMATQLGRSVIWQPEIVKPAQIRDMALGATRLVFQASCSGAGLSMKVARDEMTGLPAAWLEAGAASMISNLYTVQAGPSAFLSHRVVQLMLEEGLDPVQALRRAQMILHSDFTGAMNLVQMLGKPNMRTGDIGSTSDTGRLYPIPNIAACVLYGA
ncbi:CHAT domain-containing protein [Rhizobiaceae bacterium BDR2-2]|uniref:CHAT domain-containing protein n=1 Tax=Ectorhizobium quercum TaxID=2965071 RepID=A0AAE3N344_9HYPH|nr:CHAT domain-containing protein [Ectorhizobium quercum]MCX9000003.1 CHAT domain-containing protein [Ectorhizobium quercum]